VNTSAFLAGLRERGVRLSVRNGVLKADAPPGVIDDALRAQLAERKQELMTLISEAEAAAGAPRSLVPLKPTGDHPPLFARPGHNGDVFCYRALAEHLDARQPLYGIEPKGVDGSPVPETVEEIARYEVEQIRQLQPEGPYYVAGFCAGGTVAFETARQLAAAGQEVSRVVLFGSPFPTVYRTNPARLYLRSVGYRARRHASALVAGSAGEGVEYLRSRARARIASAAERDDPSLENRREVEDATVEAVKRYEPGFYDGRVDLFLPNDAWRHSGDRPAEWKHVAAEIVEHVGPNESDGDSMLREPHVGALAALLRASLRPG
jgi:thioesterase domain-containing protein